MSILEPQQPCIHCGDCARACPEALDPERLFFALVGDDFAAAHALHVEACTGCDLCAEACPSHIPLTEWLRWGQSELAARALADAARTRHVARQARLERARRARTARGAAAAARSEALPAHDISRDQVLAAIARGRARRKGAR
jgi:electron transport complex protein RnfC